MDQTNFEYCGIIQFLVVFRMIPPSLFKAGDFAISKRGSVLQIVKAWPQTELFGIMAGEHRGWMYTVEDDKGRR